MVCSKTVVCVALFSASLVGLNQRAKAEDNTLEPAATVTAADYARAERFLPWNADKYVLNGNITHHWIGDSDRFWYKRQTKNGGKEFVLVDAEHGEKYPAFDHERIAVGLAAATGNFIDPGNLPFDTFSYVDAETAIAINVDDKQWRCDLTDGKCAIAPAGPGPGDLISPDGKWAAFVKGPNLWMRSLETGEVRALTTDGEEHYGYGVIPGSSGAKIRLQRTDKPVRPLAAWSPDSKKLVVSRVDERKVRDTYLLQHAPEDGTVRPVMYRYRYAFPGDDHKPSAELFIFDIERNTQTKIRHEPLPVLLAGPFCESLVQWSQDSTTIYIVPREEGLKRLQLLSVETETGATRQIIEETVDTFLEAGGRAFSYDVKVLSSGEIVWYSQRDGWGHLYLYDAEGNVVRQLTSGDWAVRNIVHIDEEEREVYFLANGREKGEDIYFRHVYAVNMDSGKIRLLTPENADHDVTTLPTGMLKVYVGSMSGQAQKGFAPSGRYFVGSYSRPDLPPVTVLRRSDGTEVVVLEEADISALDGAGVRFPEPFEVLAADGVTLIYGNIYRPSNFDPARSYPVIDAIYPGPIVIRTQKDFMGALFDPASGSGQMLAELGFIVVTIDGRGTPYRSKSFQDDVYHHLERSGNLEDHVAGIKQLADRFSYLDIDRVGIYGYSGGGYASARAILRYPEFYKVAVSSSGNHDQRGYSIGWGPNYLGLYDEEANNYQAQINARLAENLKGKLLLSHGELDDNVNPALTMQLADALIKANKSFELLILPNTSHYIGQGVYAAYYYRRVWDYFVCHLLGAEPPKNYQISFH